MNTPVPSTVQLPPFLTPNKITNPFALDPNFQYWLHNYGWWHHMITKEGTNFDIKIARIAYSLGSLLAKDRLAKEDPKNVETLEQLKLKVFDFGLDADISTILEKLCGKVQIIRPSEVRYHHLLYYYCHLIINYLDQINWFLLLKMQS